MSRTAGILFRYLLLAATMFGIVVLGILLVYVTWDAVQPLTADPRWHLTFLLTLVLPTLAVGGYLYARNTPAFKAGLAVVGVFLVSLMFGAGASLVFVDIVPPMTWLAYVVAVLSATAAVVGLVRYGRRLPFLARLGATTVLFYLALFGFPGPVGTVAGLSQVVPSIVAIVQGIPVRPTDSTILALTIGGPIALAVGGYFRRVYGRWVGISAGTVAFLAALVAAFVDLLGMTPVPATILTAMGLVPTTAYAATVALDSEATDGLALDRDRVSGLVLAGTIIGGALLGAAIVDAMGFVGPQSWVDWQFLTSVHSSSDAAEAGLYPAIGGSIMLMFVVALLSFPVGIGAAVYLEEYAPDNRFAHIIDVNISNLAGVPSVVYGLLGLAMFINYLNQPPGTLLVAGATLGLLILPIVIISAREAIQSVPDELREASYGMGATRWQTVRNVVLPHAFPGILTGTILALGRAIGETAPLIFVLIPTVLYSLPDQLSDKVTAMPMQIYAWSSLFAGEDFYTKAVPAAVVVLILTLLAMNSVAIVLRNRYQRRT